MDDNVTDAPASPPTVPYRRQWFHDIASQDEGEAHMIYRIPHTRESLAELEEWMTLVLRKIRRLSHAIIDADTAKAAQDDPVER